MSATSSTIIWCPRGPEFSRVAADHVAAFISSKPGAAVALPTGQTPAGMYADLVARAAEQRLSLANARFFNLDDYVGLTAHHPLSYARFLRERLLTPAGVPEAHIRLLRGDAVDLAAECGDYEGAIAAAGGLDLAILGLGPNGHIAFNEPGGSWSSRTHVVSLSAETRAMHALQTRSTFFIPKTCITVGVETILAARKILLLVAGDAKVAALAALERGAPDLEWPVTALLGHSDVTVLCESELAPALAAAVGGNQ
jgi:glucosamine-6-phosphate deaminase